MPPKDNSKRADVLKEIVSLCSKRYADEMKWIDDIERKASSLIAVIGVVLTLSVPLLAFLHTLFRDFVDGDVVVFPTGFILFICILLFFLEIVLLGIALYHAHNAHKITQYTVPNVSNLVEKCKEDESLSLTYVYKKEISEFSNSIEIVGNNRKEKAKSVAISQKLFVSGVIVLILILILTVVCFILLSNIIIYK